VSRVGSHGRGKGLTGGGQASSDEMGVLAGGARMAERGRGAGVSGA
jgi:hypothetical protein